MQKAMYSALFGALTQEFRLNTIANNLANMNTTGFKKDKLAFVDVFTRFASDYLDPNDTVKKRILWPEAKVMSETRLSREYVDLSPGTLKLTGNSLDFAIEGEGFFKIQTPDGIRYTRDGSFKRDPKTGNLVTSHGNLVLGENGPIEIPENGVITVNENGEIVVNGDIVDKLVVVSVSNIKALKKIGNNLFLLDRNKGQEIPSKDVFVKQGYLETSNVQVVEEMVNMIETLRAFEAMQKTMQSSKEQDDKVILQVGSIR